MEHKDIRVTLKQYARFQRGSAVDVRNRRLLDDFARAASEKCVTRRNRASDPRSENSPFPAGSRMELAGLEPATSWVRAQP
jgi:hypothetical protein